MSAVRAVRVDSTRLRDVTIIEERDDFVVVAKPAGLAVHGGVGAGHTLIDLLSRAAGGDRLHLVHRLDKATSGVMIVAKSPESARDLGARWRSAEKTYLAIIHGTDPGPRVIDAPLADGERGEVAARTRVDASAFIPALDVSLVRVALETGRTHQIRRHFAAEGRPVAMDDKHGDFSKNKALRAAARAFEVSLPKKAQLLHATRLVLGDDRWTAPLPPRWVALLTAAAPNLNLADWTG